MAKKDWNFNDKIDNKRLKNLVNNWFSDEEHLPTEINIIDLNEIEPNKYEKGNQYKVKCRW